MVKNYEDWNTGERTGNITVCKFTQLDCVIAVNLAVLLKKNTKGDRTTSSFIIRFSFVH